MVSFKDLNRQWLNEYKKMANIMMLNSGKTMWTIPDRMHHIIARYYQTFWPTSLLFHTSCFSGAVTSHLVTSRFPDHVNKQQYWIEVKKGCLLEHFGPDSYLSRSPARSTPIPTPTPSTSNHCLAARLQARNDHADDGGVKRNITRYGGAWLATGSEDRTPNERQTQDLTWKREGGVRLRRRKCLPPRTSTWESWTQTPQDLRRLCQCRCQCQ